MVDRLVLDFLFRYLLCLLGLFGLLLARLGVLLFLLLLKAIFRLKLSPHVKLLLDKDEEESESGENNRESPHVLEGLGVNTHDFALERLREAIQELGADGLVCSAVAERGRNLRVRDTCTELVKIVVEDGGGLEEASKQASIALSVGEQFGRLDGVRE